MQQCCCGTEESNTTKFEHVLDHSTCYVDSSLSLASNHDVAHIDYDIQLSNNFTKNYQIKSGLVITENDYINNIITRESSELSIKSVSTRQFARITLANYEEI